MRSKPLVIVVEITFEVFDKDTNTTKRVTRNGRRYEIQSGEDIDLFPIRVLAEAIGRTPQTIIIWEREGLFPKPMYRVSNHKCGHWYSRLQILGIIGVMHKYDFYKNRYFDKERFLKEVRDRFAKFDSEEET